MANTKALSEYSRRTRLKARTGIEDFRFHDLRRTWASWHVMKGTSLQELMELEGWKSYDGAAVRALGAGASAAKRIERAWDVVDGNATISLRQK